MALKHVYCIRPQCEPSNELLKELLATRNAKRGVHELPTRAELMPRDLKKVLPFVTLARVVDDDDFEFRIIGEEVIYAYGENFTGRRLSALGDKVTDLVKHAYRSTALARKPVLLEGWFKEMDLKAFRREILLLPLGLSGQCAEYVLSAGVYERTRPLGAQQRVVAGLTPA